MVIIKDNHFQLFILKRYQFNSVLEAIRREFFKNRHIQLISDDHI